MDLTPYVDALRRELAAAAEAGGEDARALAERLTTPLESATRLALLEALSAAAGEITRELAPGSVDVRMRGRDPDFVVTPPPVDLWFKNADEAGRYIAMGARPATSPPPQDAGEGATSRITLRLPEHLKLRIDEAARQEGLSVNAWLIRAVSAALGTDDAGHHPGRRISPWGGQHYTGWAR